MNSHRAHNISCLAIVVSCLLARASFAADARDDFQKQVQPLLQTYCFDCHADGMKQGNVAFDRLKTDDALLDPHLWFNALKNVRAGLMPADGSKLKPEELKTLETWIKRDVFKLDSRWSSTSAKINSEWKVVGLHFSSNVFTNNLTAELERAIWYAGGGGLLGGLLLMFVIMKLTGRSRGNV